MQLQILPTPIHLTESDIQFTISRPDKLSFTSVAGKIYLEMTVATILSNSWQPLLMKNKLNHITKYQQVRASTSIRAIAMQATTVMAHPTKISS